MRTLHKLLVVGAMLLVGAVAAQAQPGGFPGGQMQMPSPAEIAKMRADQMKDVVKLTDKQYNDVVKVFQEEMEEMMKKMQGGAPMGDFEQMRKDMEKQQADEAAKLKKILTADQYKAWDEEQKKMMAGFGGGFGGPGPGGPGPR